MGGSGGDDIHTILTDVDAKTTRAEGREAWQQQYADVPLLLWPLGNIGIHRQCHDEGEEDSDDED
jgi:hypothetical protein